MKIKFFLTVFLSLAILTGTINAQSDFALFWTKFKTAVKKSDKTTVASLTKFPVSMPFGMRAVKTKADFFNGSFELCPKHRKITLSIYGAG